MSKKPQEPTSKKNAFVHKLYSMLSDTKMSHLIWWTENSENNTFALNPGNEFANSLTKYFKHGNVASFVRQLHMYGFHKVSDPNHSSNSSDEDQTIWEFKHSSGKFKKDDESSLVYIKRRSSSNTSRGGSDNVQGNDNVLLSSATPPPSSFNYQNHPQFYQSQYVSGSYYHPHMNHPNGYPPRMGHVTYPVQYQPQVYGYPYEHMEHMPMPMNPNAPHYTPQQTSNLPQQITNEPNQMKNKLEHQPCNGFIPQHLQHRVHQSSSSLSYLSPSPQSYIPPMISRPHSTHAASLPTSEKNEMVRQNSEPSNGPKAEAHPSHQQEPSNLQFKKIWDNSKHSTKQRNPSLLFDPLAPSPMPQPFVQLPQSPQSNSPIGRESNSKFPIKLPPPSSIHKSSSMSDPITPEPCDFGNAPRSIPSAFEKSPNQKVTSTSIPGSPNFSRKPSSHPIGHSIREILRPSLLELYKPDKVGSSIPNANDSIGSQSSQTSIFSAHSSISSISSLKRSSFGSFSQPSISALHKNSILIGPKDPIPDSEPLGITSVIESGSTKTIPEDSISDPSIKRQHHLQSPGPTLPPLNGDIHNFRAKSGSPLSKETTNIPISTKNTHNSSDSTDSRRKVSVNSLLDTDPIDRNEGSTVDTVYEDVKLKRRKTEE